MTSESGLLPVQAGIELLTPADDSPLTPQVIKELSDRLGPDWKKFARNTEYFQDVQIENIVAEEPRVQEQCQKMLKQWKERSLADVTLAMVKLNLVAMRRNDLLKDVFNTLPSSSVGGRPAQQNSSPYLRTDPNVSHLQYKHIKNLCTFLDTDHGVGVHNWKQLGNAIFQGDSDACEQMESLHLSYFGGGSPAKRFFKGLGMRHPTLTVSAFKDIALKQQRRDVTTYIESLNSPPGKHFRELSHLEHDKIALLLDKDIRGVSDWRMFADSLGFTNDEINGFKLSLKERSEYSPTQGLIDLMKQRYPRLNLTKVQAAASNIGRNDVAQYLGTVIEEILTDNM